MEDNILENIVWEYHPNNRTKSQEIMKDGSENEVLITWYDNGQKESESSYER